MMTTRKRFLKSCFAGVAGGVLASRCFPFSKSMLSIKNTQLDNEDLIIPTASDYVQDGLIALYDGIENAGVGINDPNAKSWLDLVNGYIYGAGTNIKYDSENFCFDTNKIGQSSSARFYFPQVNLKDGFTYEIIFLGNYSTSNYRNLALLNSIYSILNVGFSNYKICPPGSSRYVIIDKFNEPILVSNSTMGTGTDNKVYINGQYAIVGGSFERVVDHIAIPGQSANHVSGKIFCVRIYSKVLSQKEIAYNYSIDKIRFCI